MLNRSIVATCLTAVALAIPALATSSTTAASAPDQISVWDVSSSTQTASSYWAADLNQPNDYTSPKDYAGGSAYIKIDVTSKPSDLAVIPLICFWRHTETTRFKYETCARKGNERIFTDEGTYYFELRAPETWWQKNGTFDWSVPPSLGRIMLKKADSSTTQLLVGSGCGSACYQGNDLADHVPITMSSELIFVAAGKTLNPPNDWRNGCPSDWASACNGNGAGTTTTTTTTTTVPDTTTTTTPSGPTTTSPGNGVDEISVSASSSQLTVAHRLAGATRHQVRYRPDGGKLTWTPVSAADTQTFGPVPSNTTFSVEVRGLVGGKWQSWIENSVATGGQGGTTTTTTVPDTTTTTSTTTPNSGGSTDSVEATGTKPAITATGGTGTIDAEWSHPNAVKYQYRYGVTKGSGTKWSPAITDDSASISGLKSGKSYDFEVRVLFGGSWKPWASVTVDVG